MSLDMQSIYVLASGGSRAMEQLDTTTNNLANVNTTGFKKMLIKEMSQRLDENGSDSNHLFVFPRFQESLIQKEQGPLKQTGAPLDIALQGSGYLMVRSGNKDVLTRNGHLFLNQDGVLVDEKGNSVLDSQNKPIKLESKRVDITEDGTIYQDGEKVAKLALVDSDKIEALGGGYYKAIGSVTLAKAKVHQGFLEGSNVNPVLEMTSLITAQRRFEMFSNVIKSLDQLNQKTNDIAKA